MTDEKKHYVLQTEAGSFRMQGGIANLVANSAVIASASVLSPTEETIIIPGAKKAQQPTATDPSAIVVPSRFKWAFISVLAITVFAGVAEIIMASIWGTPTGLQQQSFLAMDFAWKAGFGALVGLLGGKVS